MSFEDIQSLLMKNWPLTVTLNFAGQQPLKLHFDTLVDLSLLQRKFLDKFGIQFEDLSRFEENT